MGIFKKLFGKKQTGSIPATSPQSKETSAGSVSVNRAQSEHQTLKETITGRNVLLSANQLLRYKEQSKQKMENQIAVTDALLSLANAPKVRLVVFRSADPNVEYPWLLAKSGTFDAVLSYGSKHYDETFKKLFGDQPYSITWADHIAENCPRPGETVTDRGKKIYADLVSAIEQGTYVIDRIVRE